MNRHAFFFNNSSGRLAGLAGILLLLAVCWAAFTLYTISRTAQNLDSSLLSAVHRRSELATIVERLARYGEIILHAPEKNARHAALAEVQKLADDFNGDDASEAMDSRSKEVLSAVFAQLKDLSANRDELERLTGLIAKRLAAFDALLNSIVETVKTGGDSKNMLLVLTRLRLELEHADATVETRWELLTSELATHAKMLRLEGADQTAAQLDRIPAQVQDLAQLRRRMGAYHQSNHEQWDVAARLLDQLGMDMATQDTPAEQRLAGLRSDAVLALAFLLAALVIVPALGFAAWRKAHNEKFGAATVQCKKPKKAAPSLEGAENAAFAAAGTAQEADRIASATPHTGRIEPEEQGVADSPDSLVPELRNLFALASPASLSLADSLRRQLASGPYKSLADEIYVRAAFGEYGKALESLEKLGSRLREKA